MLPCFISEIRICLYLQDGKIACLHIDTSAKNISIIFATSSFASADAVATTTASTIPTSYNNNNIIHKERDE